MRSRRDKPDRDSSGPALPASLPPFDQVPGADGSSQLAAHPDHPAAGREAALSQQMGNLGGRAGPQARSLRPATGRSSGSISQGGVELNAPMERSAGETDVIPSHAT